MDLGPLLNAHAFLRVERPPVLWEVDLDDEPLVRTIGEMIAAALTRGTDLADVVMQASNITFESGADSDRPARRHRLTGASVT
jgi:hypothetical protein